jgi:hypothetical protein
MTERASTKKVPGDFKIGEVFHFRNQTWKTSDIGTRTITAICLSEVWITRTRANTGVKERVRLESTQIHPSRFEGPPYSVPEVVLSQEVFGSCVSDEDWQQARRILGLGVTSEGGTR